MVGKKVDSINWAREEIATCTKLLEAGRAKVREDDGHAPSLPPLPSSDELAITDVDEDGNPRLVSDSKNVKKAVTDTAEGTSGVGSDEKNREYPPLNSAFVTFERQISAHLAVQVLSHHEPYRMS